MRAFSRGENQVAGANFGAESDWVKNVMPGGHAQVRMHGQTLLLSNPQLVSLPEAAKLMPHWFRIAVRKVVRTSTACSSRRRHPDLAHYFRTRVRRLAVAASGLDAEVRFHELRYAHASWLLAEESDLKSVMDRMGHAQITTAQKYLHNLPDADQRNLTHSTGSALTPGPTGPGRLNDAESGMGTSRNPAPCFKRRSSREIDRFSERCLYVTGQ